MIDISGKLNFGTDEEPEIQQPELSYLSFTYTVFAVKRYTQ